MKKIFVYCCVIIAAFTSCKEIDLDITPEDYFASGSFWKSNDQVAGAMLGLHSQLRGQQQNLWSLGELRAGTLRAGTSFTGTASLNSAGIITQDIRESAPGITGWAGLYSTIFQVNNFIYQVEKADYLTEAQKGYYLGQAYGLRAFYYFYLFRTYGRVPLVTEPQAAVNTPTSADQAYKARTDTEKETFDFIKSEIDKSEKSFSGNYETKNQKAQWSLAATKMLKTEVYLWSAKVSIDGQSPKNVNSDLLLAKAAVEEIIPKYNLINNFAEQFKSASMPTMKGNAEMIFVIRYLNGETTSFFNNFIYAASDDITGYVDDNGQVIPKDPLQTGSTGLIRYEYKMDLYRLYGPKDSRANATFLNFNKGNTSAVVFRKFLGTLIDGVRNYSDDYPIYRAAEAYLLLAEIKNKLGEDPTAEIMAVRNRAYGGLAPTFDNGGFEANELAIFYERTKEFVSEGKRWFDLRRMQDGNGLPLVFRKNLNLVGVLDNNDSQKHKILWPIDLQTLTEDPQLNDQQNPGYKGT